MGSTFLYYPLPGPPTWTPSFTPNSRFLGNGSALNNDDDDDDDDDPPLTTDPPHSLATKYPGNAIFSRSLYYLSKKNASDRMWVVTSLHNGQICKDHRSSCLKLTLPKLSEMVTYEQYYILLNATGLYDQKKLLKNKKTIFEKLKNWKIEKLSKIDHFSRFTVAQLKREWKLQKLVGYLITKKWSAKL